MTHEISLLPPPKLGRKRMIMELLSKLSSKESERISTLISLEKETPKDLGKHFAASIWKSDKEWYTQHSRSYQPTQESSSY